MYYYGGLESVQDLNMIFDILIWSNPQKKSTKSLSLIVYIILKGETTLSWPIILLSIQEIT